MTHHVFSVWGFMSLVKYLQRHITSFETPWMPRGDLQLCRFINQLVLEEGSGTMSDAGGNPTYGSHFEYYCNAMDEIGADAHVPWKFLDLWYASRTSTRPSTRIWYPCRPAIFPRRPYDLIREDKPHMVAAALALGQEQVIPEMFRRFLNGLRVGEAQAPIFHGYLECHIEFDSGLHGLLSLRLLEILCGR